MVWALPRSLAATCGIILIFSSSGYLDVSVHRVPSVWLWIRHTVTGSASRVPPFRYPRIPACLRLPVAFRSLSRLSSALSAKASTLRPFLLNLRSSILSYGLVLKMSPPAWRFMPGRPFLHQLRQEAGASMLPHLLLAIVTINLKFDFLRNNYLSIMTRLLDVLG